MKTKQRQQGFTLVEMAVTMGVVSLLGVAVMTFYLQSLNMGYASQQQISLIGTMRSFTSELIYSASRAHEMILYPTASAADRNEVSDRRDIVSNEDGSETRPTGNLAVFVYYELPKPATQARHRINRIIAYFPEQTDSGPPRLTRLTIDLRAAPSTLPVEELLTTYWSASGGGVQVSRKTFAPRVAPLALSDSFNPDTDEPQLFYKRSAANLAVCGQLFESNSRADTKDQRTYTRTFFFTVTTRS